ncbi:LysR family transcriptional regulator [Thalassovita mediterranea]|jgi:DNA-binding transcriptional LysR family regulator|uniref:HTH-type transcriptional regulator YofA n=1 Tax=Thalassovita mediterranea TaxID=340021 RepID=A0A0N7M1U0_9RHOB|nr:LysR family transcriptional regulator [Thalassovita mediterranea]CUH84243.1 HTH-type transcriptional regulator YofA [Thalassovita mediterranea]SIS27536.1 transcriptional regulator, LysR family [Thalassovita mediterranea]
MRPISDIRILNAFVAVAQEGNISRAAKRLHLTQPAVSLQLKRLAQDTGLDLFRRTPQGVELTRDGEALVAKAEKIQAAVAEFGQTARRINGNVRGTLRLGTIVDPDFIRLGAFLAALVDGFPDLQTKLVHGISGDVVTRLLDGQVDAGFFLGELDGFEPGGPDQTESVFHDRELTKFTYRVIAPAGWGRRIAGKDWTELAQMPWIGTPRNSVHHRLLAQIYADKDCSPDPVCLVDQEPSMLAMVQSGIGLSLCRESIALEEMQSRGLAVSETVKIETCLRFVTLASRRTDPNVVAAFDALSTTWT